MSLGISVTVATLDGRWKDLIKIRGNIVTRNEVQGNIRNRPLRDISLKVMVKEGVNTVLKIRVPEGVSFMSSR